MPRTPLHPRLLPALAALVVGAFLAAAAPAQAKLYTYGPRLSPRAASLTTTDGLGYRGIDTPVPPAPDAPNGVVHTPHYGADTAIWNTAVEGHSAAVPRAGQAVRIKLEGCAVRPAGAPAPLTQVHFQTLAHQGTSLKVALTSAGFEIPVCGAGGAGPSTVTTYTPVNLCVHKGDYVGFNDEGGFVQPWYRAGVPYKTLGSAKGSEIASFIRSGGTGNGAVFSPGVRNNLEGFATRSGEALMMQVVLGTGPDARYVCPGGTRDAPPVLPALRVSRQTDGINRARIVAVAVYCRPATGCNGSAAMQLAGGPPVGHAQFSLPANKTSHLPIRVAPQVLGMVRRNHGVTTRVVLRMGRKSFSQLVTIKIL
jgi:hypothetical protein